MDYEVALRDHYSDVTDRLRNGTGRFKPKHHEEISLQSLESRLKASEARIEALSDRLVLLDEFNRKLELISKTVSNHPVLSDLSTENLLTVEEILEIVSRYEGVSIADLKGPRRNQDIIIARQIACFLAVNYACPQKSYPQIGRCLGGRDHSTILCAVRRIKVLSKTFPKIAAKVLFYQENLTNLTKRRQTS